MKFVAVPSPGPAESITLPSQRSSPCLVRERGSPRAVIQGSSQSGRNIRTFLHLGFNQDEQGRIV